MSTYRDDLEAALARNADLEHRIRELEAARQPTTERPVPVPVPRSSPRSTSTEIATLVDARARAIQHAQARQEARQRTERERAIQKLLHRPMRVGVEQLADRTRITFARKSIRDGLVEQAVWGIGFAAVNPGLFVVIGLTAFLWAMGVPGEVAALLSIPLWIAILMAINIIYARVTNRAWYLDLTGSNHFAVHRGNPHAATLFGVTAALDARLDEHPDPSRLHAITLKDGHSELAIDALTDRDVRAVRAALRSTPAKL